MYSVFIKNDGEEPLCIYDDISPAEELRIVSPKLILEDNTSGSFSMTVPGINIGYEDIHRLSTDVFVYKNNKKIWAGRIMSENDDFFGNREFTCEGVLSFLNDTYQPQQKILINRKGVVGANAVAEFLGLLLNEHNSKVNDDHKIYLGRVTVTDDNNYLYRYTNFDTTLACIKEKLVDRLGGHVVIRFGDDGKNYLDYLADYNNVENTQVIEFGLNLLDFTKNWDMSYFASAVLPLGATDEEENESESSEDPDIGPDDDDETKVLEKYVMINNKEPDYPYVVSHEAVENFGWIAVKVVWDYISRSDTLLQKALEYLRDLQYDSMYLEISAFDLSSLDVNYEEMKILDLVRVRSDPHGLDRLFPVTKIEIPLDDLSGMTFGMGVQVYTSLTSLMNNSK